MKKGGIVLLLAVLWGNMCFSQSFEDISKKIKLTSHRVSVHMSKMNHRIRLDLHHNGKLNFLNKTNDTIWILESQFIDSGMLLGRIWNVNGSIDYAYLNGNLDINTYKPFTKFVCKLIEDWDTTTIRIEEKAQPPVLDAKYAYASRVIVNSGVIRIDTISFNELFNWKRDVEGK